MKSICSIFLASILTIIGTGAFPINAEVRTAPGLELTKEVKAYFTSRKLRERCSGWYEQDGSDRIYYADFGWYVEDVRAVPNGDWSQYTAEFQFHVELKDRFGKRKSRFMSGTVIVSKNGITEKCSLRRRE